jgi:hypothetical protein
VQRSPRGVADAQRRRGDAVESDGSDLVERNTTKRSFQWRRAFHAPMLPSIGASRLCCIDASLRASIHARKPAPSDQGARAPFAPGHSPRAANDSHSRSIHVRVERLASHCKQKPGHRPDRYTFVAALRSSRPTKNHATLNELPQRANFAGACRRDCDKLLSFFPQERLVQA